MEPQRTMPASPLLEILKTYDGKHIAPFRSIAEEISIRPDALEIVVSIIESKEPNAYVGGTWILKHLLELGLETNKGLCTQILHWLKTTTENDARLHLLQILNLIDIPKTYHKRLYSIACSFTNDKNTLVRAWAYNTLGIIAHENPNYKAETFDRFEDAMKTDSPSVNARIRNTKLYKSRPFGSH